MYTASASSAWKWPLEERSGQSLCIAILRGGEVEVLLVRTNQWWGGFEPLCDSFFGHSDDGTEHQPSTVDWCWGLTIDQLADEACGAS